MLSAFICFSTPVFSTTNSIISLFLSLPYIYIFSFFFPRQVLHCNQTWHTFLFLSLLVYFPTTNTSIMTSRSYVLFLFVFIYISFSTTNTTIRRSRNDLLSLVVFLHIFSSTTIASVTSTNWLLIFSSSCLFPFLYFTIHQLNKTTNTNLYFHQIADGLYITAWTTGDDQTDDNGKKRKNTTAPMILLKRVVRQREKWDPVRSLALPNTKNGRK